MRLLVLAPANARQNAELGDHKSKLQALWEQGSPESAGLRTDLAESVQREEGARAEVNRLTKEIEQFPQQLKEKEEEYETSADTLKTKTEKLNTQLQAIEEELSALRMQHDTLKHTHEKDTSEMKAMTDTNAALQKENEKLKAQIGTQGDTQKEHEDLLILLEDMSAKRKADKMRMRQASLEVSDEEEEDE